MIVTNLRPDHYTDKMNGDIAMSDAEWTKFQAHTAAQWRPRTISEFNAMCDLAAARYQVEEDDGMGASAMDGMKFTPEGEARFPMTEERRAYFAKYGRYPTTEQLREFSAGTDAPRAPGLSVVK